MAGGGAVRRLQRPTTRQLDSGSTGSVEADETDDIGWEGAVPVFPSLEWVRQWVELSNGSDEFQRGGRGWEGAVCLVVRDVPAVDRRTFIRLDGRDGHWSQHDVGTDPGLAVGARVVLDAPCRVWNRVIRQELS